VHTDHISRREHSVQRCKLDTGACSSSGIGVRIVSHNGHPERPHQPCDGAPGSTCAEKAPHAAGQFTACLSLPDTRPGGSIEPDQPSGERQRQRQGMFGDAPAVRAPGRQHHNAEIVRGGHIDVVQADTSAGDGDQSACLGQQFPGYLSAVPDYEGPGASDSPRVSRNRRLPGNAVAPGKLVERWAPYVLENDNFDTVAGCHGLKVSAGSIDMASATEVPGGRAVRGTTRRSPLPPPAGPGLWKH
jgi:hypothetical protein